MTTKEEIAVTAEEIAVTAEEKDKILHFLRNYLTVDLQISKNKLTLEMSVKFMGEQVCKSSCTLPK